MIKARIVPLGRRYMRLLRTDKERVGVAERWVRAVLMVVPFFAVVPVVDPCRIMGTADR